MPKSHLTKRLEKQAHHPFFTKLLKFAFVLGITAVAVSIVGLLLVYKLLTPKLPDIEVLQEFRYQMPMSIYTNSGKLIAQFGEKKSTPVDIDSLPQQTINSFLAAEDDRFFDHPGVDYQGLLRAVFSFVKTGEKRQGGSTITMQVARNFFLSSEKTFLRKVKEILLAIKIESKLPKKQILELYLNKIYFGHHAYGVESAAQVYYGKHVSELSLGETAMIAGLPKAPSNFNPITNPQRALIRRNYVLKRMLKLGLINDTQFKTASMEPVNASLHTSLIEYDSPYVAEMVRSEIFEQFGEAAYENGYKIFTTIDERLQKIAEKSVRRALHEYDERHGFRGHKRHIDLKKQKQPQDWDAALAAAPRAGETVVGLVTSVRESSALVYLGEGQQVELDWDGIKWARKYLREDVQGPMPKTVKEVMTAGDIIRLREGEDGKWQLTQTPEVEGALVSINPTDGRILALVGGYDFSQSKFNRVTQAQRQPGSGFKPILYAAALDKGYTPASIINDAPFVFYDPALEGGVWRPQNYTNKFYGPTRLRVALAKSRNLVSIRLLREVGLKKAIATAREFGFSETDLPRSLSLALGSGNTTVLKMAQAYAVFANGGFRVDPHLIERIQRQDGETVFQATPSFACADCENTGKKPANLAPRVITPQVHYMMHSMLQDVVRQGTAVKALQLGRSDLAGKTGTTNEQRDAWFNGYTPELVAITWLGFDSYKPLGDGETGGHTALPMWINFMKEALEGVPERSFSIPDGLTTARIDPASGLLAPAGSSNALVEIFPSNRVPRYYAAPPSPALPSDATAVTQTPAQSDDAPPAAPRQSGNKTIESLF